VLARGGFSSSADASFPELRRTVNGVTFGKIFEGDVTMNDGLGTCFAAPELLAEVAAHEIGHAIGFGHSSENPSEPDAMLADALMFFRAHDDGRGASVRADDVAAMLAVYPDELRAQTPVGGAVCEFGLGLLNSDCFGVSLPVAVFTRFDRGRRAAEKAGVATTPGKQRKQLRKALQLLNKTDKLVQRNVGSPCREAMLARIASTRTRAQAALAGL
jgi:hypothetical protein